MQIEYDREVPLGQGGYGSFFPGKYNGRQVAVKRVQLYLVSDIEEIDALQRLDHPNIVKLFYSESDENFKYDFLPN
jgi:serine/threonine protein kinase